MMSQQESSNESVKYKIIIFRELLLLLVFEVNGKPCWNRCSATTLYQSTVQLLVPLFDLVAANFFFFFVIMDQHRIDQQRWMNFVVYNHRGWHSTEHSVSIATLFSPYASRHHQKAIFTFLLVNRQLLFESKTNDRRFGPLAHHHVGRRAKPGGPMNAEPRQAGGK